MKKKMKNGNENETITHYLKKTGKEKQRKKMIFKKMQIYNEKRKMK